MLTRQVMPMMMSVTVIFIRCAAWPAAASAAKIRIFSRNPSGRLSGGQGLFSAPTPCPHNRSYTDVWRNSSGQGLNPKKRPCPQTFISSGRGSLFARVPACPSSFPACPSVIPGLPGNLVLLPRQDSATTCESCRVQTTPSDSGLSAVPLIVNPTTPILVLEEYALRVLIPDDEYFNVILS